MSCSYAKVGHFGPKGFVSYVEGSEEYCRGWADGYNSHADVCVTVLIGEICQCGKNRQETIKPADNLFEERVGCLRCGRWDNPKPIMKR